MGATGKIELRLLEKMRTGGAEMLRALPVFVSSRHNRSIRYQKMRNVRVFEGMGLVYGEVLVSDIEELAAAKGIQHVWDAVSRIELTPPAAVRRNTARTDIRTIIMGDDNGSLTPGMGNIEGTGIKVGVIDTSVDAAHADIRHLIERTSDCTDDGDFHAGENDHGTHVAGIVAQVAPASRLYLYKVFGASGVATRKSIVEAIAQAVADGVDVINGSWGEAECKGGCPVDRAVSYAVRNGTMFVGSAGNQGVGSGSTLTCPAGNPDIITVGACTLSGRIADFSSRGPSYIDGSMKPDVVSPGVDILSCRPGGGYCSMSGTSMASPGVAGGYAVLKGALADGSAVSDPRALKQALIETARALGGDPDQEGRGLVNITASIRSLAKASRVLRLFNRKSREIAEYTAVGVLTGLIALLLLNMPWHAVGERLRSLVPAKTAIGQNAETLQAPIFVMQGADEPDAFRREVNPDGEIGGKGGYSEVFEYLSKTEGLLQREGDHDKP